MWIENSVHPHTPTTQYCQKGHLTPSGNMLGLVSWPCTLEYEPLLYHRCMCLITSVLLLSLLTAYAKPNVFLGSYKPSPFPYRNPATLLTAGADGGVPYQLWYWQLRRARPEYRHSHTISESHSSAGSNGSWTERNCPLAQHQWFDPAIAKQNKTKPQNTFNQLSVLAQAVAAWWHLQSTWVHRQVVTERKGQLRLCCLDSWQTPNQFPHTDVTGQGWLIIRQYRLLHDIIIIIIIIFKDRGAPGQPGKCHCCSLGSCVSTGQTLHQHDCEAAVPDFDFCLKVKYVPVRHIVEGKQEQSVMCAVRFGTAPFVRPHWWREQLKLGSSFVLMREILTLGFASPPTHQSDKEQDRVSVTSRKEGRARKRPRCYPVPLSTASSLPAVTFPSNLWKAERQRVESSWQNHLPHTNILAFRTHWGACGHNSTPLLRSPRPGCEVKYGSHWAWYLYTWRLMPSLAHTSPVWTLHESAAGE